MPHNLNLRRFIYPRVVTRTMMVHIYIYLSLSLTHTHTHTHSLNIFVVACVVTVWLTRNSPREKIDELLEGVDFDDDFLSSFGIPSQQAELPPPPPQRTLPPKPSFKPTPSPPKPTTTTTTHLQVPPHRTPQPIKSPPASPNRPPPPSRSNTSNTTTHNKNKPAPASKYNTTPSPTNTTSTTTKNYYPRSPDTQPLPSTNIMDSMGKGQRRFSYPSSGASKSPQPATPTQQPQRVISAPSVHTLTHAHSLSPSLTRSLTHEECSSWNTNRCRIA